MALAQIRHSAAMRHGEDNLGCRAVKLQVAENKALALIFTGWVFLCANFASRASGFVTFLGGCGGAGKFWLECAGRAGE